MIGSSQELIFSRDVPDGNFEAIINCGDAFVKCEPDGLQTTYNDGGIKGQFDHAVSIGQSGTIDIIGVCFKPFGLYPFIQIDMCDLTNLNGPLELLFTSDFIEKISNQADIHLRIELLNNYLLKLLSAANTSDIPLLKSTVNMMNQTQKTDLKQVADKHNLSLKSLERKFKRCIGLTPKKFDRIHKIRKVSEELSGITHPNWFEMILKIGAHDQAHFCREFKRIVGATPTEFIRARDGFSHHYKDIYPKRDS